MTPMTVLYDSLIFSRQMFGGISQYIVQLIRHLPPELTWRLPLIASDNHYLRQLPRRLHPLPLRHMPERSKLTHSVNRLSDVWNLRRGKYDVVHSTDYNPYYLRYTRRPVVVTVHDMIHEMETGGRVTPPRIRKMVKDAIMGADRLIAISRSTRDDLVRLYGIDEGRIDVVHHGVEPLPPDADLSRRSWMPQRYLLFVGQRGDFKNFDGMLNAFSLLLPRYGDLQLVATGRPFSGDEQQRIAQLGLTGRVHALFADSADMPALYANAEAFIFPSYYEGFGLPILEAFAAGCPVALSNASCFPEIAGEGALYFDPADADEIAAMASRLLDDRQLADSLRQAARERARLFSWERTARLTCETYCKAINS